MSRFELVIFDCDGVLVDSERITNQVFCTMLNELGLSVALGDMFEHFVGQSMRQCLELVSAMYNTSLSESFVEQLRLRTTEALKNQIKPIPGVADALKVISIPYCVASSGEYDKICLTLGTTGLLRYFENKIFSVSDVKRPKPAPDIFLHAAKQLSTEPSRCAVIEDTPTGVRAAVAAGMHVFGFSANTPEYKLKEAGAHVLFSEMQLLPRLLNNA